MGIQLPKGIGLPYLSIISSDSSVIDGPPNLTISVGISTSSPSTSSLFRWSSQWSVGLTTVSVSSSRYLPYLTLKLTPPGRVILRRVYIEKRRNKCFIMFNLISNVLTIQKIGCQATELGSRLTGMQ